MREYFILGHKLDANYCTIDDFPDDMPDIHCPAIGVEMGDSCPKGLKFKMSADSSGLGIPDVVSNSLGYLIVSARLKALLEAQATAQIEYLRFSLLNHKRRVAVADLYVANLIGTTDCVDKKNTEGDEDPVNPGQYQYIHRLSLLPAKIDPRANLFRISAKPKVIIVREDLRGAFQTAGITGAEFHEVGSEVDLW